VALAQDGGDRLSTAGRQEPRLVDANRARGSDIIRHEPPLRLVVLGVLAQLVAITVRWVQPPSLHLHLLSHNDKI
jgi:hypothetical protein